MNKCIGCSACANICPVKCINMIKDIERFMGSKDVQRNIGNNYSKCYEFLKQGMLVLFTGTPCQIAGLKAFLPQKFDNLICQDLICHGVPSQLLFKSYLNNLEAKEGSKIIDYYFRSKYKGWKREGIEIVFENNKKKYSFLNKETYSKIFIDNGSLRNSCYDCSYKGSNRVSDITLADFWGIEKILPNKFDDKGISLVILNTAKGKEIFERISECIDYTKVNLETAIAYNESYHKSPKKPLYREQLVLNTAKYPYKKLLLRYSRKCMVKMESKRIKSGIKRLIKPAYHYIKKL